MITVENLIKELNKFPKDALCYAYEGEVIGVIVVDSKLKELGYIECTEAIEVPEEIKEI